MKDYAKEAIHNVENTRLISILKALALAIQADVNSTLTPEQCRTIVREMDYLRQEGALLKRAEMAEARVAEFEKALKKAEEILEIWECEGTLGEGGEELAKIVRAALIKEVKG